MVKVSSIHRNSAGRKNARDVVNAPVRALQQSHQIICDVTTHAIPRRDISIHRSNAPKINAMVVVNALVHAWIGMIWRTMRRETKYRMSTSLSMNVRSGVIQKNMVQNHGKKNAIGMLAAHVLNVPMRMNRNVTRTLVTIKIMETSRISSAVT
jgi:hypothetical protein